MTRKLRGVKDILIACVDGLSGFPEAIKNAYPMTEVQLCIVHQIENSLRYLSTKHFKEFMVDLKEVYRAPTLEVAKANLDELDKKWTPICSPAVQGWKNNWSNLSLFFRFPQEIRTLVYTTHAVEGSYRQFRKVTKN